MDPVRYNNKYNSCCGFGFLSLLSYVCVSALLPSSVSAAPRFPEVRRWRHCLWGRVPGGLCARLQIRGKLYPYLSGQL